MTDIAGVFADEVFVRDAETALEAVTTEQPRSVEPLGRGNRKQTALVRFDGRDPVVLQLCEQRSWLRTESVLLTAIQEQTDVPVPPVLAADVTPDTAFMLTSYVPGTDLHEQFTALDRTRQQRLSFALGRYLGTLHEQFRFDGYGRLVVEGGRLTAHSQDWGGWLDEYGRRAVGKLPSEFDPIRRELRSLISEDPRAASPEAHLFPWDFRPGNAIVGDDRVTAVLDWEAPMAAAPALSTAKAVYLVVDWYAEDPAPLRAAFVAGYGSIRSYPDIRPVHRAVAIADSAVDSAGVVTTPGYPELDREGAVAFHRAALADLL